MRTLAFLIGLVFVCLGTVGLVAPGALVAVAHQSATPLGLWVVALIRCGIGAVLYGAGRSARHPTALRLIGALFIVTGIITPFFGSQHARAIVDTWATADKNLLRLWGAAIVALGVFTAYTVSDRRRVAYRPVRSFP